MVAKDFKGMLNTSVLNKIKTGSDFQEIMTVDELANLLRIARGSAYRAVKAGEVPGVVRIGKTLRIHRPTVLRWLEQGCVSPDIGEDR